MPTDVPSFPLTRDEALRLTKLEEVVERGMEVRVAVASALIEIRDRRLYRQTHPTFESYAQQRFSLVRRTAYGYIEAAGGWTAWGIELGQGRAV